MRKKENGFTLIEILIVMGLTGFLFVGLFSLYFQVREIADMQGQSADAKATVLTAASILSEDINNLYAPEWNPKMFFESTKGTQVTGRFDSLNFISTTLWSNPTLLQTPVHSVYWYVEQEGESATLFRSENTFTDYKKPTAGIPVPMIENIEGFEVQFSLNGEDWIDGWSYSSRKRLPPHVKVVIRWQDGNSTSQYEFEASPQVMTRAM